MRNGLLTVVLLLSIAVLSGVGKAQAGYPTNFSRGYSSGYNYYYPQYSTGYYTYPPLYYNYQLLPYQYGYNSTSYAAPSYQSSSYVAPTTESYSGDYNYSDYTYKDGYWWKGGYAYIKKQYYNPGYYYNGYYYAGSTYYKYEQVPVATKYVEKEVYKEPAAAAVPKIDYTTTNWRSQLLEIARQRDVQESKLRTAALEHAQFVEAVNVLGMGGNFRINGYGQYVPYGGVPGSTSSAFNGATPGMPGGTVGGSGVYSTSVGNFQLGAHGVNGNTVYGYSYRSISDLYGDTNLNTLYQQAARLTQNAQQLSGQASSDFSALVSQEGGNRARVAEILAKGQAAAEALRAMHESGGTVRTETFKYKVGPDGAMKRDEGGGTGGTVGALSVDDAKKAFIQLATNKCASCHNPNKKDGGFDINDYFGMTAEEKGAVWGRLTTTDPKRRMPLNPDGTPGQPLSAAEIALFKAH